MLFLKDGMALISRSRGLGLKDCFIKWTYHIFVEAWVKILLNDQAICELTDRYIEQLRYGWKNL